MARYVWQWDYRSGLAIGVKGEPADLPDELAERVNRDSPGVLAEVVDAPAAETRAIDAPPVDRMQRAPARKRGAA